MGCGESKLRIQNKLDFITKMNVPRRNFSILLINMALGLHKLGLIHFYQQNQIYGLKINLNSILVIKIIFRDHKFNFVGKN